MVRRLRIANLSMVICIAGAVACAGRLDEQESSPTTTSDAGPERTKASPIDEAEATRAPREDLPACEPFTGPAHAYSSAADVEARLAGVWLLCNGKMAAPNGARGIEIAGGRATFVVAAAMGLVRSMNEDHLRAASVVANGDAYELRLESSGDAGLATDPTAYTTQISEDGRCLELSTPTTGTAHFVRAAKTAGCESAGPVHPYTSVEDVRSRLAGRWMRCGGDTQGAPADSLALEFDGDTAHFLVWSQGSLVHGPGWDYYRDVSLFMTSPNQCQVDLWSGAFQYAFFTRVSEDGDYLEMDGPWSSATSRYVRLP